ncbi:hypothetical protein ACFWP0_23580 [Achromobacter sp. NPDC058515]|uniref:hypothetical protein n=1 Tax=Achromobacter sp. NPDC058515 TaxID=3346533 RepID=UPI00365D400F
MGSNQLAEISHEPGKSVGIEIYPPVAGESWTIELEEFISVLNRAIRDLDSHRSE